MHFRKSHVRANKLDVQETNFSSPEAEIIFLDAGLRMDVIPALDLWDLEIEIFHSSHKQTNKTKDVREPWRNLSATLQSNMQKTNSNNAHQSRPDQH